MYSSTIVDAKKLLSVVILQLCYDDLILVAMSCISSAYIIYVTVKAMAQTNIHDKFNVAQVTHLWHMYASYSQVHIQIKRRAQMSAHIEF